MWFATPLQLTSRQLPYNHSSKRMPNVITNAYFSMPTMQYSIILSIWSSSVQLNCHWSCLQHFKHLHLVIVWKKTLCIFGEVSKYCLHLYKGEKLLVMNFKVHMKLKKRLGLLDNSRRRKTSHWKVTAETRNTVNQFEKRLEFLFTIKGRD